MEEVWATLHQGVQPVPPVPQVDFASHSVLLAAMGRRSTGGYEVGIPEVGTTDWGLSATVVESSPGEGWVTTQALTALALAVAVAVPNAEVRFEPREETRDC